VCRPAFSWFPTRLTLLLTLISCTRVVPPAADVDDRRLATANADSSDWLTHGRTYDEQRFSPLTQINDTSVKRLGLAWSRELDGTTRGVEATPLVSHGMLYTTGPWSVVYAFDARTGEPRWTYDPKVQKSRGRLVCCDVVNRGLAMYRGKVYVGTIDGRLIALDAVSGAPAWFVATVDTALPYAITGAPRIAKGLVLIGNAGAEYDVRGYVSAYDAETGKLAWRTYTVPGDPAKGFESKALERAAATWHGKWWEGGGGATVWDAIVYDPALELVYVGTANGHPWYRDLRSEGEGDNLYISSILALRVKDGEQVWHFQTVPGDHWDYDATQPLMLADLSIGGRVRKVIMQANKNAFFYVLDRQTGELISAKPFAFQDWAAGLDPKTGRPVESATAYARHQAVAVSPGAAGGHNWNPMSFSPRTGLVYVPMKDHTVMVHMPATAWKPDTRHYNTGADVRYAGRMPRNPSRVASSGHLLAWDPVQQRATWTAAFPVVETGGTLATAGNLVFQGRSDGMFAAYRATDGQKLWELDAGTGSMAAPITYAVAGTQYVTVMAGFGGSPGMRRFPYLGPVKFGFGRIVTFALGAKGTLTPPPFGHTTPPVPAIQTNASPATIKEGGFLYAQHCRYCHGIDAIAGSLPDLRYASADVHANFEKIVLGGAREALGMPSFSQDLKPDQVKAIQSYVLWRAAQSSKPAAK
jgi:quinohemoprotein ethanol dehydrogenase